MPKSFDKSTLGFSSGNVGSTNSSNVTYSIDGNTIIGSVTNTLEPGQALTIRLTLPEGYNSAEVGFLYEGSAETKGIISLLIYLANNGYLEISETEEKSLFSKSKGFKITKLLNHLHVQKEIG